MSSITDSYVFGCPRCFYKTAPLWPDFLSPLLHLWQFWVLSTGCPMANPCAVGGGWLSQIAMRCGQLVLSSQDSLEETGSNSNPVHHRWILNRMPLGDKALQTQQEASFVRKRLKYGLCCTNRQVIGEQLQLQFTLQYPLQLCFNSTFMG